MNKKLTGYWISNFYFLCMMLVAAVVNAGAPQFIPTDAEIKYLPAYCAAKLRGVDEQRWRAMIGGDFQHLHHMCYAQNAKRKALSAREEKSRKYLYSVALKNYEYMETHADKDFILRPAIYIEKAGVFRSLKQNKKAEEYYLKAIEFKPDYAKAYAEYSGFLKRTGQKERAIKILEQGLVVNPNSKSLKRRIKKLRDRK